MNWWWRIMVVMGCLVVDCCLIIIIKRYDSTFHTWWRLCTRIFINVKYPCWRNPMNVFWPWWNINNQKPWYTTVKRYSRLRNMWDPCVQRFLCMYQPCFRLAFTTNYQSFATNQPQLTSQRYQLFSTIASHCRLLSIVSHCQPLSNMITQNQPSSFFSSSKTIILTACWLANHPPPAFE